MELHAILVESICRNIRLIEIQQEKQSEETELFTKLPEILHFKPQGCGHLFTVAYPGNSSNDNISKNSYSFSIYHFIVFFILQISCSMCCICMIITIEHLITVIYIVYFYTDQSYNFSGIS